MANTYTWTITQLDCYPAYAGETDVVTTIHWTLSGSDGATPTPHTGSVYGTVNVKYDAGEPFTPYAQLTQAQVVGWVTTALGPAQVAAYEANIDNQIAQQISPNPISPPLPWVN
jgi:hypothetical protein